MNQRLLRQILAFAAAIAILCACTEQRPIVAHDDTIATPEASDAVGVMNREFRERYAETREQLRTEVEAVLFVSFGRMTLRQKGEPDWVQSFSPPIVDQYKTIAHVPLGIYVMAAPFADGPASDALRAKATTYRDKARTLAASVDGLAIPPAERPRQRLILDGSLQMLDRLVSDGTVSRRELDAFARRMGPPQLANADIAAALTLDELAAVTAEMRTRLRPGQWDKLYVLVMGNKMPRAGNLQYEYFVRLMGRGEIERRLLYSEGLTNPDAAAPLIGTLVIDRDAALAFFGDRYRLDRVLLADGARKHLDSMFRGSTASPR
ncbi:MAG: hypothetical protein HQ465_04010 [Rhodospirillales bacterium]|nr:hypothetical protein [Rhodospirillales bacterium]